MKLFTVGPCQMYERTLRIGGEQVPYFRNDSFSNVYLDAADKYKRAVKASADDHFIALTASGTGAMEAAVLNCLTNSDKALVVVGGSFGTRFSQICEVLGVPHEDLVLEYGHTLTQKDFERYEDSGFTALLINMDETSIGQLYDIPMVSGFCKRNNMLLIVDAISAFASDPLAFSEWGIDVLITSSQKGLALPPGMSFVVLSDETYRIRVCENARKSFYFDFRDYVVNGYRGQTPFTPAVSVMYQFKDILDAIEEDGGVDTWVARTGMIAEDFRNRLKDLPLGIPEFPLSNALTPVVFPNGGAKAAYQQLESEYGLVVNPCGGDRADKVFRIAHIGNHNIDDNIELIAALGEILQ